MFLVNHFPDHPWMSWTIFILLQDIYVSGESFPRPSWDVLDYFSYHAILPWDIYCPYEQFPRPSPNMLDYFHIMRILLQDMYDSCEQFPRPPCECPGLLLIKGQTMCLIGFKEDKNIRSPVHPATNYAVLLLFWALPALQELQNCVGQSSAVANNV